MKPMLDAVGFLTVAGGRAGRAGTPDARSAVWFPVVGAVLGLGLGAVWWAAEEVWTPAVAAALVVGADLAATGMLHMDGLADSADGLLPHLDRQRRLDVMADPAVGAFGVTAVALAVLLRWSVLASLEPDPLLLAGVWSVSRAAMAVTMAVVPYARPSGLASAFAGAGGSVGVVVAVAVVVGLVPALVTDVVAGSLAVGGVVVGAAVVVATARRRIGGFTGDVLGAAGVTAETVGLLAAGAVA